MTRSPAHDRNGTAAREKTWDELRPLDAGRWFAASFAGEPIPRLEEVLIWQRARSGFWSS